MNTTTVFKLSVYGFLAYCGCMLCVAQESLLPQGLLLVMIPVAYYLTERRNTAILPTWVANGLGLIAVFFSILEFNGIFVPYASLGNQYLEDLQIRAGTNLIVYLSCIVLFMEKRTSYYWGILVFGVLMVALGCMFTNSTEYSLLLILFLIVGIWTLITFMIYEAQLQHFQLNYQLSAAGAPQATDQKQNTKTAEPQSRFRQKSTVKGTIKLEEGSRWFTKRLLWGFLIMCLLTFLVSMIFYMFIPRAWVGNLRNLTTPANRRMETGFNDKVKLGGIGSLLSSSELVMEFDLKDQND
ncbi:MAG: DUF3488 domain-containing protein, partial [Planctomycetaceae bacterium]|nr:DUF3488 domain-containing protein [Planctomycetaceae bacterium]